MFVMDIKTKKKELPFCERPLIFLDLETTGLSPQKHEILEIGAIKVKSEAPFDILEELEIKVKPEHLETADPEGLKVAGYSEEGWQGALSIKEALEKLDQFGKDGVLVGYNVTFDWAFLDKAYTSLGRIDPFHYHRLDILSMAYFKLAFKTLKDKFSLGTVCQKLAIQREFQHRALYDAKATYLVFKQLFQYT